MVFDTSPEKTQVSWNIVSSQAQHIHNLMKKATTFYLNGDLGKWYWTLSALRENINYDLNTDQRKILDDLEKDCNGFHSTWESYRKSINEGKVSKDLKKSKGGFSSKVREYQREMFDILKSLGYFPDKEDRTKLSF